MVLVTLHAVTSPPLSSYFLAKRLQKPAIITRLLLNFSSINAIIMSVQSFSSKLKLVSETNVFIYLETKNICYYNVCETFSQKRDKKQQLITYAIIMPVKSYRQISVKLDSKTCG